MLDLTAVNPAAKPADAETAPARKKQSGPEGETARSEFDQEYAAAKGDAEDDTVETNTQAGQPGAADESPVSIDGAEVSQIDAPIEVDAIEGSQYSDRVTDGAEVSGNPELRTEKNTPTSVTPEQKEPVLAAVKEPQDQAKRSDTAVMDPTGKAAEASPVSTADAAPKTPKTTPSVAETAIMSNAVRPAEKSAEPSLPRTPMSQPGQKTPIAATTSTTGQSEPIVEGLQVSKDTLRDHTKLRDDATIARTAERVTDETPRAGAQKTTTQATAQAAPSITSTAIAEADKSAPPVALNDIELAATTDTSRSAQSQTTTSAPTIFARSETPHLIARQMAEVLQRMPDGPVEIALSPKELGRVRMSITAAEAGITVSVIAERPETLDLMRRNVDDLARDFQSLGYESVSFSFNDSPSEQAFDMNQNGDGDKHTSHMLDAFTEETPVASAPLQLATTGVDIRL
ncbi:MAG: flagellar hook-length control protein FliK [Pseudomonadota bacterium]